MQGRISVCRNNWSMQVSKRSGPHKIGGRLQPSQCPSGQPMCGLLGSGPPARLRVVGYMWKIDMKVSIKATGTCEDRSTIVQECTGTVGSPQEFDLHTLFQGDDVREFIVTLR